MAKLKRTLVYPDGFGTFDVEADDEAGLQDGINDIDQQFETHTKAKRNLAELNAAPMDRQRGLYAGAPPTMEEPELLNSGLGGAAEAGGQAWQRGVGRVAGNLAAVPSALDRTIDDAGEFIVGGGLTGAPQPLDPFDGQVVKKGVPLYAGKRILDTPQTSGGPAMLSGVADDIRHGLPEMPSGYSRALAGKNLSQKIMDPTWYGDMLAGNAPQMGVSLLGGALGGKPGAALASGAMMAGDEFQRTQDFEEETGRRAENAGAKALLSGGLQGALDSIVPGSIATGGVKQELGAFIGTVLKEGGTEALQKLISDVISPAETRSFGDRMTDPKYLMDLAEEGVAGGIMGGAMHPLGQSGISPKLPPAPTLKERLALDLKASGRMRPADIIEGRDGATGMQPVDMRGPEKGVSAAVAPNPDRSARVVPVGTSVPDGMAALTVDGGLLLYDKSVANPADVRQQTFTPEGLDAFLAQHGTPSASGQPSTTDTAQAAPPPLLVPPVAQTDAEVAELAKQIAARPAPPKALEPEEVAKKIERLVADPRTTPEEREILVAKYEQLASVVRQRVDERIAAVDTGPVEPTLDGGPPLLQVRGPESALGSPMPLFGTKGEAWPTQRSSVDENQGSPYPYSDDYYFAEAIARSEQDLADANRRTEEESRGRALLAALSDPAPRATLGTNTRLDLLYDLKVNGLSLSSDERTALDAEIAAEEAKLAPPPEATPEPSPPVPGLDLSGAYPETIIREADERRAEPLKRDYPEGRLGLLVNLWNTEKRLSPDEKTKLWEYIVREAGGPAAAEAAVDSWLPAGEAQGLIDQIIDDPNPNDRGLFGQVVDASAPKEGLAARKARERAEAARAAATITISKPPPGPKKPPPAAPAPKAEPQQKSFAVRQQEKRGETPKSAPKAEAKPEPKPVAKEAPVAQPVQQAKAAPAPDKKQARLAELAEAEAAVAEAEQALAAAPEKKKWQFESQLKAARAEVLEVRRKARGDGVSETEMGPYRDPLATKSEAPDVTPQVTIETSPFMQARRAAEAEAAKETKPEPKKEPKPKSPEAKAAEKAQKGKAEFNTTKTVEKKLAAAVAKERALQAEPDAPPENKEPIAEPTKTSYSLPKQPDAPAPPKAKPDDDKSFAAEMDALLSRFLDDDGAPSTRPEEVGAVRVRTHPSRVTSADRDRVRQAIGRISALGMAKTIPQREARVDAFGKKEPMSREAFSKALEAAKAKLPGIADLVDALDSQADLPSDVAAVANGDRIDGFTQNGRVVVVADGMTSPEHVAATLAHEAVGHLVPEETFGRNEWRKRLDEMMASSTWFRDFVANFGKSEVGSRYKAAELASEAVAFEANKVLDDANYKPPNAYRMFIAKLREWLREAIGARRVIGLSKVLEFSDRDLAAFLARSKRTAETGLPKNRHKGDTKPSFAKATPGTTEPIATAYSEADYIDVPEIAGFDVVRRAMEDDMIALRRAEEAAAKKGTSRDEVSMYKASDERHGKAATEIQDVRSQFVTPIIKMAHKAGVTLDEIGDWLYAVHALGRNAEGRKRDPGNPEPFSGMSDAEATAKLNALRPKAEALSEVAEVVYAMLAYERKRIVEAGLATKEEVEGWRKTWGATYVPLKHQEMDEARSGNAKGYNVLKRAAKHATGRRTEADNPLYSAVSQVQRSITRAHNAEVGRQFDLFVQDNPNPEYWIRNPKPKTKTLKTKENEDGELETKVVTVNEPTFMRDDILHVKDKDGNDVEIQILHKDVLRAMTRAMSGMGDGKVEKVLAKASAFTRVYGGLLTQYNLEFLLSNPIRDLQGGAANMAVGYGESVDKSGRKKSDMIKTMAKVVGGYGKSVKGIVQFMRDPNSKDEYAQLYAQMRREGATVGWAPFEDPKKVENQIKSDMNSLKRGALHPKEWLKKANEAIHTANTIAENGTRLSIYKMLGDKGITGRERVSIVKNATVNFNKRGEFGPVFNTGWIFGQVGVLGPAAMLKFAKRSPKRAAKMAAALTTLGWAQAMLLMAFSGDDDEDGYSNYSELQESEKSRNWILGKGKMPIGHSWSFFVNLGRHMAETQNGLREWRDLPGSTLVNMMDSFSPLGASGSPLQAAAPWFADPFVQMGENKTAFDAPIYPDPIPGAPKKPQSQTHFRSAPQWAKSAAEGMNALGGGDRLKSGKVLWDGDIDTSPETLQHLYDFSTQGAVKFATRTLAAIHNAASGQETRVSDIPVVRRFMTSEHPGIDRGRYIRQKQDLADKFAQAKGYKGLGERGEADKDLKKYDALLAGPLRSRTDFMKLDKLYAQLDDGPQDNPEIEALKKRVIAVAGRQYELSKKVDVYVPLDEGLLGDLEEKVETVSPKKERSEAKEEIETDLEGK